MPTTRFDGLPSFEALVAQEVARYRAVIDEEICQTEQIFLEELNHVLRTFQVLRQNATSAEEIARIDAAMTGVRYGFTVIRLEERSKVWATAITALDC